MSFLVITAKYFFFFPLETSMEFALEQDLTQQKPSWKFYLLLQEIVQLQTTLNPHIYYIRKALEILNAYVDYMQ